MALFPTNATQIQAFAGALYGVQVGSATMAQVNSDITAAGGLDHALNAYYTASFGNTATATVAASLVANIGISAANSAAATAYVTGVLNSTAANARGAAVMNILNLLSSLTADATYGAEAAAWNAKVESAVAYTGSTNVAIGSVVASTAFTLTAGLDTFTGTAGNDVFTATATTLSAGDTLTGGTGNDTLNVTGALTAAIPAGVTLSGVEKVNATSTSTLGTNSSATASAESYTVTYTASTSAATAVLSVGGVSVTATAGATDPTGAANATATAAALTAIYGALGYAVVSSGTPTSGQVKVAASTGVVTVTGYAGVDIPNLTITSPSAVNSLGAIAVTQAVAAATPVAYDLSSTTYFAGVTDFSGVSDGGANVKLQKTTNATLVNQTGGAVNLDGGAAVAITTTGTSAVGVTSKGATTVTVTGGTGATIDNVEDSTAATTAVGKTMTAVTLTNVDGNSAVKGQALSTLTIGGATTAARTVTVTDAAVNHALTIVAAGTGYNSTGATEYQTVVTDTAARAVTLTVNAKSSLDLSNNSAMTSLAINGSGALKLASSVASLTSIDGSAATGNLTLGTLNAATRTVKGGAGNDSATITATGTVTIDAAAGNDTVTLASTVAAGSSIQLGAGNDKLLNSYSSSSSSWLGSVATGYNSTTGVTSSVDGGDGTNGIAASLVNGGNSTLFKNFQTLILDNLSGSFDSTLISGITGLEIASAAGGTYTGLTQAQSLTVTNTATPTGTTTLTMTGVTGTADAYAITFSGAAQTSVPTAANIKAGAVAVAGIENVSVASGGATNTWNSLTLGANTSGRTVTITGAQNLDLAFASGGFGEVSSANGTTGVSSIDGSAATGKLAIDLTYVVPATAGLAVKGGSAVDTITTSAKATLTLGAGADVVNIAASKIGTLAGSSATEAEATAKMITITDVAAGDTIDFSAGSTTAGALGAATSVGSATTLLAALNALANAGGTGSGLEMAWGVYGGNTYVVLDAAATSTSAGILADDVVLKLTGIVDLTGSTLDTGAILTIV